METSKKIERRSGPDFLIKSINILAIVSWLIIIGIFVLLCIAKPSSRSIFGGATILGTNWDKSLMNFALFLLVLQLVVSAIGLIMNASRKKRKSDRYSGTLVFISVLSLMGIAIFLFTF